MARQLCRLLVFLMPLIFLAIAVPAGAQTGTPPTPTATVTPTPGLLQTCLDEGVGKCLSQAFREGGWLLVLLVVVGAVVVWLLLRVKKVTEIKVEKALEKALPGDGKASGISGQEHTYLQKVKEDYIRFTLRGLGGRARDIDPPQLDQAYISLRLLPEVQRGERFIDKRGTEGVVPDLTLVGDEAVGHMAGKVETVELPDALASAPRLAIVGAAGSGKTTLLQWVGLAMVCAMLKQAQELRPDQKAIVQKIGRLLPVLIPLREYNRYCIDHRLDRNACTLLDYITTYVHARHPTINLSSDFFFEHLKSGVLLMFDGVDEVAFGDRPAVRTAIEHLLRDFKDTPTRCLITSRSTAYFGPAQLTEGFAKVEVQSLTPSQRVVLLHNWYRAIYHGDVDRANAAAEDLCKRIDTADPRVQDLARTPLMVTIFAIVHQEGGELPRQRAELYEKCVNFLLTEPHHKEDEAGRSLQDWGGIDPAFRLKRLAYIAFQSLLLGQRGDAILEDDLVDLLWREFRTAGDEAAARLDARSFLRLVADRGGLLEERDGYYGFYTHRTFREYLAGRFLGEEMDAAHQKKFLAEQLATGSWDSWEEAILLAAGYQAIGGERRPNEFLNLLADLGDDVDSKSHALARAMQALADLTPQRKRDDRVYPETRKRLTEGALAALRTTPPVISIRLRDSIGRALGRAGDPRFDPRNPALCEVEAGTYRVGTNEKDKEKLKAQGVEERYIWNDEKTGDQDLIVSLSKYAIGKYPVTNCEFRAFWEAGGYGRLGGEKPDWWSEDGWQWRTGQWDTTDFSFIADEDVRKQYREWLAGRPVERRDRPFWWEDPQLGVPNLPVVGVCWFEAEAYCKWLSSVTGRHFTLPAEAQWEAAARGPKALLWPWGNTWDAGKCNNAEPEDRIGLPTPVGMYTDGASPCGALDMAGNVWEWCADWYAEDTYEKRKDMEVVDPTGPETGQRRVLRGGSWTVDRDNVRCACRSSFIPDFFDSYVGFRLVLSPI